jgi:hypothetical protein
MQFQFYDGHDLVWSGQGQAQDSMSASFFAVLC